jgi:hypothetical protein
MQLKNIITPFLFMGIISFFSNPVNAQLDLPQGSQRATVSQTVGISDISINYSRPSVKGREIWGKLVPYGMNNLGFGTAKESPWRAGANESTTITFSDDMSIEGKQIEAGTYALFMVVHENDNVDIILSKNSTAWGSYFYNPEDDVLKVTVKANNTSHTELLTFDFIAVEKTSATAALQWGEKEIPFKIEVPVSEIVLNDIRHQLEGSAGFSNTSWVQAANYSLNNDGDLNEALVWVDGSLSGNFYSQVNYNNLMTKSRVLQKMGKKEESLKMVDEAASMANKNQLNALGYQMLNQKEYDLAIKFFKLNVKNNPTDPNVYDSLGEGYKTMGDKKNAIKYLKKSLSLNPAPNVKANSEKLLEELGVVI